MSSLSYQGASYCEGDDRMFDRFRKKTQQPAQLQKHRLIEEYKQMLPEFANFVRDEKMDARVVSDEAEKRAKALQTLISASVATDTPRDIGSILADAGLGVLDNKKLKEAQAKLYRIAANANMQCALDVLEGTYWSVPAVRAISGEDTAWMVTYDTAKEFVRNAATDWRLAGDTQKDLDLNRLSFKLHMIRAKDPFEDEYPSHRDAIVATSYLLYKPAGSQTYENRWDEYFTAQLKRLHDSFDAREMDEESFKERLGAVCDRMLDVAVDIGFLSKEERGLIPRDTNAKAMLIAASRHDTERIS